MVSPVGINTSVRTDAEGRVEYLNEAALGILGESADSVMGEYAADVLPIIQIDTRTGEYVTRVKS